MIHLKERYMQLVYVVRCFFLQDYFVLKSNKTNKFDSFLKKQQTILNMYNKQQIAETIKDGNSNLILAKAKITSSAR